MIGHEQKDCRVTPIMTAICKEIPLYGAKLSVPPAKPLSWIIKDQQKWRRNKEEGTSSHSSMNQTQEAEGSSNQNNHGGKKTGGEGEEQKGGEMGQSLEVVAASQPNLQGVGKCLTQNSQSRDEDPRGVFSFIRYQQQENWEAQKKTNGYR